MKLVLCFCLLAIAKINANPILDFMSQSSDESSELSPMIVNGHAPTDKDHIAHAVILFATQKNAAATGRLGGGSIISPKAVLTVAHVLKGRNQIRIGYGSRVVATMKTTDSERVVLHPKFDAARRLNDIAIIFVQDTFDFTNKNVAPITLPNGQNRVPNAGTVQGLTVGYGFTAVGQKAPNAKLLAARVTIILPRQCERLFRKSFETHLCARDKAMENAANVCLGDNGNGLYVLSNALRKENDKEKEDRERREEKEKEEDKKRREEEEKAEKERKEREEKERTEREKEEKERKEREEKEREEKERKEKEEKERQQASGNDNEDQHESWGDAADHEENESWGEEHDDSHSRKRRDIETPDTLAESEAAPPPPKPILVGLASIFSANCVAGQAGGYTNVVTYAAWIRRELKRTTA